MCRSYLVAYKYLEACKYLLWMITVLSESMVAVQDYVSNLKELVIFSHFGKEEHTHTGSFKRTFGKMLLLLEQNKYTKAVISILDLKCFFLLLLYLA